MKLYIEQEEIVFDDTVLDKMYVDEGNEGIVYKYKDEALKLYKPFCRKYRLDEKTVGDLINISVENILLPRKIIRDELSSFLGYTTSFIESSPLVNIEQMKMDNFLDNLISFYEEGDLLGENQFELEDLGRDNLLYDGKIFVSDPGSISVVSGDCKKANQLKINEMILQEILAPISIQNDSKKRTKLLVSNLEEKEEYFEGRLSSYIDRTMIKTETVKKYVKRMNQSWNA